MYVCMYVCMYQLPVSAQSSSGAELWPWGHFYSEIMKIFCIDINLYSCTMLPESSGIYIEHFSIVLLMEESSEMTRKYKHKILLQSD